MASFNRVILVGNITRDPELRTLQSGTSVTDVGLAVNERRRNQSGEWVEETNFFDLSVWGRNAEIVCQYTRRGSAILVEGKLKQDSWEQDGQKRSRVKVMVDRIQLLSARDESGQTGDEVKRATVTPPAPPVKRKPERTQHKTFADASGDGGYGEPQQGAYFSPNGTDDIPF